MGVWAPRIPRKSAYGHRVSRHNPKDINFLGRKPPSSSVGVRENPLGPNPIRHKSSIYSSTLGHRCAVVQVKVRELIWCGRVQCRARSREQLMQQAQVRQRGVQQLDREQPNDEPCQSATTAPAAHHQPSEHSRYSPSPPPARDPLRRLVVDLSDDKSYCNKLLLHCTTSWHTVDLLRYCPR